MIKWIPTDSFSHSKPIAFFSQLFRKVEQWKALKKQPSNRNL